VALHRSHSPSDYRRAYGAARPRQSEAGKQRGIGCSRTALVILKFHMRVAKSPDLAPCVAPRVAFVLLEILVRSLALLLPLFTSPPPDTRRRVGHHRRCVAGHSHRDLDDGIKTDRFPVRRCEYSLLPALRYCKPAGARRRRRCQACRSVSATVTVRWSQSLRSWSPSRYKLRPPGLA